MVLHHHPHSSFAKEFVVQQDNGIACLKFFSARFLVTPLLVRQPKDYRLRLHHHYYHLAPH
jgi:hypothetical protein